MLGWLIILGVSVLILVIFIIAVNNDWFGYDWEWIGSVFVVLAGVAILTCIIVVPIHFLLVRQEVKTFKLSQEMVEISYSEEEPELNYAMNVQVIEMNKWLVSARAKEELYGIFSFYKDKLDDLEYIEIGD